MTPQERAARASDAMLSADGASPWFGIELVEIDEAHAVTRLEVAKHHTNGHGICHGGVIFSLADTAFAYAGNSRNVSSLAQAGTINFLAPARLGDVLTATAQEIHLRGRNGLYDMAVTNQRGETIAQMRGQSRALKEQVFEERP